MLRVRLTADFQYSAIVSGMLVIVDCILGWLKEEPCGMMSSSFLASVKHGPYTDLSE